MKPLLDAITLVSLIGGSALLAFLLSLGLLRWEVTLHIKSLRLKILFTYLTGFLIVPIPIILVSRSMFISAYDFELLIVTLAVATLISIGFGLQVGRSLTAKIEQLAEATRQMAGGDLDTRVQVSGRDDLARLGEGFNSMAAQVQHLFAQLKEMEEARTSLFVSVSHDLRTPLSAMRVMIEALNDGVVSDTETISRYHHTMQEQVKSLSSLIDDLFDLSQLDAGVFTLRLEETSISDLVSDTLESMRAQAAQKRLVLDGYVAEPLPLVKVDPQKLQRVLYNLMQNAIRHTPPDGSIMLNVISEADAIRVDVHDSGEGVSPADKPHIFDYFYRGEQSRSREYGGAGLGLSIAQRFIEAHGGKLWLADQPSPGCTFSFTLPLTPPVRGD